MTIKQVLISALRLVGRDDIAYLYEDDSCEDSEDEELVRTLVYCINATENELARYYFPILRTQRLTSEDGFFPFSSFEYTPVRILSVKSAGKLKKFETEADGIRVQAKEIEVAYHSLPGKKSVEDESEYAWLGDENITALGAAAEFQLIWGRPESSDAYERRYRDAINRAISKRKNGAVLPPRRWI